VIERIDRYLQSQPLWLFCCVPGSSEEPVDIRPEHGKGVIQTKYWIKPSGFKLSLSYDTALSAFKSTICSFLEDSFYIR
jgi:hypothetical protein